MSEDMRDVPIENLELSVRTSGFLDELSLYFEQAQSGEIDFEQDL